MPVHKTAIFTTAIFTEITGRLKIQGTQQLWRVIDLLLAERQEAA